MKLLFRTRKKTSLVVLLSIASTTFNNKKIVDVENSKGEMLGSIFYDKKWKKWVWVQLNDVQMSSGCLDQVSKKMEELSDE